MDYSLTRERVEILQVSYFMETGFSFTMLSFCGPCIFSHVPTLSNIAFTTGWFIFILFNHKVDLKRRTLVTRILTQGRQDANQWVTSYTVSYSNNGRTFRSYTKRGRVKVPCTKIGLQCVHDVNLLSRTEKWIVTSLPGVYGMCLKRAFWKRISKEKFRVIIFSIIKIHQ